MDTIILAARVLLGFIRLNNDALIMFVRNVVILMTGNASYPTPFPALTAVTDATDALETLTQQAMTGDRLKISARKEARQTLLGLMRKLANYVQAHCQDNVTILLSSGFQAARRPGPSTLPATPYNARLGAGAVSGSAILRHSKSANADNYTVQIATSPEGPFVDYKLSSSTRTEIEGRTPGTMLYARARANGAAGSSDFSNVASRMII